MVDLKWNSDELSRRLLDESPGNWPEVFGALNQAPEMPQASMSEVLQKRLTGMSRTSSSKTIAIIGQAGARVISFFGVGAGIITLVVTISYNHDYFDSLFTENRPQENRPQLEEMAKNRVHVNRSLIFKTVAEIQKHYGKLNRVVLKDGRIFQGYAELRGDSVIIHIIDGIVVIDATMVLKIKESRLQKQ